MREKEREREKREGRERQRETERQRKRPNKIETATEVGQLISRHTLLSPFPELFHYQSTSP